MRIVFYAVIAGLLFTFMATALSGCAGLDPYFAVADDYIDAREKVRHEARLDEHCKADSGCHIVDGGYIIFDDANNGVWVEKSEAEMIWTKQEEPNH